MKFKLGKVEFQIGSGDKPVATKSLDDAYGRGMVRGKYDAAQTNHMNSRHWANADSFSADQANNPGVRKVLRDRSRYEIANNGYFMMVEKFSEEIVGTGARMEFVSEDPLVSDQVETAWDTWHEEIDGPEKVKLTVKTGIGDGEGFLVEANGNNEFSPVQLDYFLLDAERCTNSTDSFGVITQNDIDGIMINNIGKPISYRFLKNHPGSSHIFVSAFGDANVLPASMVIHFFKKTRPEQHRGIPEITAALPLGSKMRSFTLSTIEAAKIASTFSGVLHTEGDPFPDATSTGGTNSQGKFKPFESFGLDNGMFLTLPQGWKMDQVKAEHPMSTYKEFKREIVAEMAASLSMPYNVAASDSAGMNYSSGRLDRLSWRKVLKNRQAQVVRHIMRPMFIAWWNEAVKVEGLLPQSVRRIGFVPEVNWSFDGDAAIDPEKESKADKNDLESLSITHADVYARKGKTVKKQYKQLAFEKNLRDQLGLTMQDVEPSTSDDSQETEEEETNEDS